MRHLHLAELRNSWSAWLGVTIAFITINFTLTLAALTTYSGQIFVLSGAISVWDSASLTLIPAQNFLFCSVIGAVVIGSATSLVVDCRRGSLGRLALTGATPGQIIATIMSQLTAITLASAAIGDLAALLALQPTLTFLAAERGGVPVPPAHYVAWPVLVANALAIGAALIGGRKQARRASEIAPVEALRQTHRVGDDPMTVGRWVGAGFCTLVIAATYACIPLLVAHRTKETLSNMVIISLTLLIVTAVLLSLVGPRVVGPVTAAWTRLVPAFDPSWQLTRSTVLARAPRLTKSVLPVMMTIGLFFGLQAVSDTFVASLSAMGMDLGLSGSATATLLVFLALPLLIAFTGSMGSLIMMSKQRDAELALSGIVGTTPAQRVAMPILEAVIITITGTLLAAVMVGVSVGYLAIALPAAGLPFVFLPAWGVFATALATAAALTVAAILIPTLRSLRLPEPTVIARLVAE